MELAKLEQADEKEYAKLSLSMLPPQTVPVSDRPMQESGGITILEKREVKLMSQSVTEPNLTGDQQKSKPPETQNKIQGE